MIGRIAIVLMHVLVCASAQNPDRYREPYYVTRHQEADGSWSPERGGGKADARLRVTAWMLLAKLGEGTTLEPVADNWKGSEREYEPASLGKGVEWLRKQLDKQGRLGLRDDTSWILDHAIATYALVETRRLCERAELEGDACKAADALRKHVQVARPAPGAELRLWGQMIVRSLRAVAKEQKADGAASTAVALAAALTALPVAQAKSPREEAAENLRLILAGGEGKPIAAAWFEEPLRDPLTALYAFVAAWQRGGKEFAEANKRVFGELEKQVVKSGPDQRSWDPVGDFGKEHGRYGTTAMAVLLMEVCYRHALLDFCRDD